MYTKQHSNADSGFKGPSNVVGQLVLNLFSSHNWSCIIFKNVGYLLVMAGNGILFSGYEYI